MVRKARKASEMPKGEEYKRRKGGKKGGRDKNNT
jgi:hypothetical protein